VTAAPTRARQSSLQELAAEVFTPTTTDELEQMERALEELGKEIRRKWGWVGRDDPRWGAVADSGRWVALLHAYEHQLELAAGLGVDVTREERRPG
jgi:hypothetical protein